MAKKRVRGHLRAIHNSNREYVNIQDYLESEYSIYLDQEVDQQVAFDILSDHYNKMGWDNRYHLYDGVLYQLECTEDVDLNHYLLAEMRCRDVISIDCLWSDDGDLRGKISESLVKLKERYGCE